MTLSLSKDSFVTDIPIVREFLEVFFEELPGIPVDRKIEFLIKSVLRTQSILRHHTV